MIMTDAGREATVSAPAQRLTVLSRARPYRGHSGWAILNPKTSPPPCAKLKVIDLARARNEVHCFPHWGEDTFIERQEAPVPREATTTLRPYGRRNPQAARVKQIADQAEVPWRRNDLSCRALVNQLSFEGRKGLSRWCSTPELIAVLSGWEHGSRPYCSFEGNSRSQDKREFRDNH